MSTSNINSTMLEENLSEKVQAVVELSETRVNTVVEDVGENDGETIALAVCEAVQLPTKSLQSLNLDDAGIDGSYQTRATARTIPSLQTQDSMQRLQSSDDAEREPTQRRRPRRRRKSLKDSITALFSASNHRRRTHSPRDPQWKPSQRSGSFSISNLVSKRCSVMRRKTSARQTFSSLEFDLRDTGKMDRRRSGPLRQSSSTAFTSAALEVSEDFREDEKETPPLFSREIY